MKDWPLVRWPTDGGLDRRKFFSRHDSGVFALEALAAPSESPCVERVGEDAVDKALVDGAAAFPPTRRG
jgi:hypothetical protein